MIYDNTPYNKKTAEAMAKDLTESGRYDEVKLIPVGHKNRIWITYKPHTFKPMEASSHCEVCKCLEHVDGTNHTVTSLDPFDKSFANEYALALRTGQQRFGSDCKHENVRSNHCTNCLRKVL